MVTIFSRRRILDVSDDRFTYLSFLWNSTLTGCFIFRYFGSKSNIRTDLGRDASTAS
jgi:hypothetical protein